MQGNSEASIVFVGVETMQGRTHWVAGFVNNGHLVGHFSIEVFLYVFWRGLGS